ncbi:LysR family transcriptional regulator [Terribacillus saccharophilus]|uniref:LysR family transcriptional regulator n=1 Tax=Terribacillus saccharophilus TaxID=361277 RepID=UPI003D27E642
MNKRECVILITIYEEKNITKAADRLFVSQPTLTYKLQQLERQYNTKILNRGRHGVQFTQQGEYLVDFARSTLKRLDSLEQALWDMDETLYGTVRLSVARAYALYRLPNILKGFSHEHPQVNFVVDTGLNLNLIQEVFKGDSHIGIVRGEHHWGFEQMTIGEEEMCVLSKEPIKFEDLPHLNRITYNTDPALNMVIENWWKQNFSDPSKISLHLDNMETAKRMALEGLGYTIVPSIVVEKNQHYISLLDKNGAPLLWRTWFLYRKESLEISAVREFVHYLHEVCTT